MANIKTYTDMEQSKKLAEILPIESADMFYNEEPDETYPKDIVDTKYPMVIREGQKHYLEEYGIPCWSLAALLGVLPQSITKYIEGESCQKTFHLNLFRSYYHCVSYSFTPSINDDNTLYCIGRDNWVDACVAMIEKLHELKML